MLVFAYPADMSAEFRRISHLAVCGFHFGDLGLIETEEIPFVGGELPDLFKVLGFMSMSAILCAYTVSQQVRAEYMEEGI